MKQYVHIVIAGFLFLMTAISHKCDSKQQTSQSELVLAAVVENIGKNPGVSSGVYLIYQLAKYRVVEVCAGTYTQKEIVVDHLLITGDELKSLRIGDKVFLTVHPSKAIGLRFDEEGFRSPSDKIETFYLGDEPEIIKPEQCKE